MRYLLALPVAFVLQLDIQTAGGSFTDVGICTGSATLHRDDYKQLFGTDKHSWVVTGDGKFVHAGQSTTIPLRVESVRQTHSRSIGHRFLHWLADMHVGNVLSLCSDESLLWLLWVWCQQSKSMSFELNIEARTLVISTGTATHTATLGSKLQTPLFVCASSTLSVGKVRTPGALPSRDVRLHPLTIRSIDLKHTS